MWCNKFWTNEQKGCNRLDTGIQAAVTHHSLRGMFRFKLFSCLCVPFPLFSFIPVCPLTIFINPQHHFKTKPANRCMRLLTHTRTQRFDYAFINEVLCARWRWTDLHLVTMSRREAEEKDVRQEEKADPGQRGPLPPRISKLWSQSSFVSVPLAQLTFPTFCFIFLVAAFSCVVLLVDFGLTTKYAVNTRPEVDKGRFNALTENN